jgi:chemotaxis protein MotA
MDGLRENKYLQITKKRFDPLALFISLGALTVVFAAVSGGSTLSHFLNMRSILIVFVGTLASLLFQFDFSSILYTLMLVFKSFMGSPEKNVLGIIRQLNDAIVNDAFLTDLREGSELNKELLNDIVYMHNRGLLYEEINEFVTSRISSEFFKRQAAVTILNRAAVIAPALGLFGTVIGLIGVLKTLSSPGEIGPSMSLALMTTAYGAGLGSLIFTPMAGRLEHHNAIFLQVHKELLSKVGILLTREERRLDKSHTPKVDDEA